MCPYKQIVAVHNIKHKLNFQENGYLQRWTSRPVRVEVLFGSIWQKRETGVEYIRRYIGQKDS